MNPDDTKVLGGKPPPLAVAETQPGESNDTLRTPAQLAGMLGRGALVGRYLIVDRLGSGGMGVVYGAYDPELDRKIAIKVLRLGEDHPGRSSGRARLLREAQALARLSSPHVVAVHDVGTYEDGVFLAMDLVEGTTLRAWQVERKHAWREVRDVYREAGRGLIAAHEAGIVHRDFKPENVLVGRDGKVRVTDFGLARVAGDPSSPPIDLPERPTPMREESSPSGQLTQAGTILGTPPYMSPEQHAGRPADSRSDQFSFCVSLTEALYGQHPFKRERVKDMVDAIRENRPRPAPAGVKVPAWMRRALLRGMLADPAARWPDMRALLAELSRDGGTRRRTTVTLAVGLLLGGSAAFGLTLARHSSAPAGAACGAAASRMNGVWDAAARDRLHASFTATGASFAEDAFQATARELDGWAARWRASSEDACRATRVAGVQSEELLDRRTACLDDRRSEARELVTLLGRADTEGVAGAVLAAASLTPVDACDDLSAMVARGRVSNDPRLASLRDRLGRARALRHAGRFRDALDAAVASAEEARGTELAAEALLLRGALEGRLGKAKEAQESLTAAAETALAAADEPTVIEAWTELIRVVGHDLNRYDQALGWARMARAALARGHHTGERAAALHEELGLLYKDEAKFADARAELSVALSLSEAAKGVDDPNTISRLGALGTVALAEGKLNEARGIFEKVLERERRAYGAEHPALAAVWSNLGVVAYEQARYPEALEAHQHALDLRRRALGGDHPEVSQSESNIGVDLEAMGRFDDALAAYGRALAIAEKRGAENLQAADALGAIGGTYHKQGRFADSLEVNQRALAIKVKLLGAEHLDVGQIHSNLGVELKALGRVDEAVAEYERARAILIKVLGPEHISVGVVWDNLGEALRLQGKPAAALEAYQRSIVILEKQLGKDHPVMSDPMTGEGRTLLALGRAGEALAVLEPALAMREKDPADAANLAETRFATAQALVASGKDRARALDLAGKAREVYAKAGPARAAMLKEVDAWLAAQKH